MEKIKEQLKLSFDSSELEVRYKTLIEEAYNLQQTDASLSDYAAYEAFKITEKTLGFERTFLC